MSSLMAKVRDDEDDWDYFKTKYGLDHLTAGNVESRDCYSTFARLAKESVKEFPGINGEMLMKCIKTKRKAEELKAEALRLETDFRSLFELYSKM